MSQLQAMQRQLGDSVTWIVDTLLLDDDAAVDKNGEQGKPVKERKREAIESLAYVRDVLKGIVPSAQVEQDRLLSEDEVEKRREKAKKAIEEAIAAVAGTSTGEHTRHSSEPSPAEQLRATLTPPKPAAMTLPQFPSHPSVAQRRSQDYFSLGTSLPRSPPKPTGLPAQHAKQKASSPTPSANSVLTPNKSGMPLAPWNYTPSSFSSAGSPTAGLPRLPSKPSAAVAPRPHSTLRMPSYSGASSTSTTSQTPSGSDQPPPAMASVQQDPLGVLR